MKLISIDVGIKNLAFCFMEQDVTNIKILKWDVINLSQKVDTKCVEMEKNGCPCNKPAKFTKNSKYYCLKHSKKQEFQIPAQDLKPAFIKKQTIQALYVLAEKYKIKYTTPIKKAELVSIIHEYIYATCFEPVEDTNASKIDLVTIGRNIQYKMDELNLIDIDKVIIENQISPIANRMKTIQGMIAQYFIMKNNHIEIDFVNASNKLKIPGSNSTAEKTTYSDRKKQGIAHSLELMQTPSFQEWDAFFKTHKKKDDLADCFLQGIWYIHNKNKSNV